MALWWAAVRAAEWDETHAVVLESETRAAAARRVRDMCVEAGVTLEKALLTEIEPTFQAWARRHNPAQLDSLLALARGVFLRVSTVRHVLELTRVDIAGEEKA